jgi:hypothetical protein
MLEWCYQWGTVVVNCQTRTSFRGEFILSLQEMRYIISRNSVELLSADRKFQYLLDYGYINLSSAESLVNRVHPLTRIILTHLTLIVMSKSNVNLSLCLTN